MDGFCEAVRGLGGGGVAGVVIAGPAGVGRTRLAEDCLRVTARNGRASLRAYATSTARSVPLAAFCGLLPADVPQSAQVAAALTRLGRSRDPAAPVLFVDDAHLLDDLSATIVYQAVRRELGPVLLTVRAGEPLPPSLAAATACEAMLRVDLAPLPADEVRTLLHAVLDGPVAHATMLRIQALAGGIPFYLRRLVVDWLRAGTLTRVDGLWHLDADASPSARLVELVTGRLADSDPVHRTLLELLAVGEPIDLGTLRALTADAAVEQLERRGLVAVERDDGRRLARLAHPLYGDVLRRTMPVSAVRRHSDTLANAVEAAGPVGDDQVLRWALWRLDSQRKADPALLSAAVRRAAAHRADPGLRERLARRAFADGAAPADGLALAQALFDLGRAREAERLLVDLVEGTRNEADRVRIAGTHAAHLAWGADRVDTAVDLLRRAHDTVTGGHHRGELLAQQAALTASAGRPVEARDLLERARRAGGPIAGQTGRQRRLTDIGAALACLLAGRLPEAERRVRRLLWADPGGENLCIAYAGLPGLLVRVLGDQGRTAEALTCAAEAAQARARLGDTSGHAWVIAARASLEVRTGDLDAARRHAGEAAHAFTRTGSAVPRIWCLSIGLIAALQAGDDADADRIATALASSRPAGRQLRLFQVETDRARGWLAAHRGDPDGAAERFATRARRWIEAGAVQPAVLLALDLIRLDRPAMALELPMWTELPRPWPFAETVERFARAAATRDAPGLLAVADGYAAFGLPLYAAEAAALALAAGGLGARGGRARVLTVAGGDVRTPLLRRGSGPVPLTPREREVAVLAGEGMSNRAIARRLTVSERTVENHLNRAYGKLAVQGRADLPAALGLADPWRGPDPTGQGPSAAGW